METSVLSPAQTRLKLAIFNKQAESKNSYEFYSEMKDLKLPNEVIEILERILKVTTVVTGKTISIGKIIVTQLLKYVADHPIQVVGLAVGLGATYTLGIALHGLFALIPALAKWPIIGGLLSKLALLVTSFCKTVFIPIMLAAPIVGVVAGDILDKKYPEVSESLKQVSKDFFESFSQLINSIKNELNSSDVSQAFA
jgi:uncharacterized membrane protein